MEEHFTLSKSPQIAISFLNDACVGPVVGPYTFLQAAPHISSKI